MDTTKLKKHIDFFEKYKAEINNALFGYNYHFDILTGKKKFPYQYSFPPLNGSITIKKDNLTCYFSKNHNLYSYSISKSIEVDKKYYSNYKKGICFLGYFYTNKLKQEKNKLLKNFNAIEISSDLIAFEYKKLTKPTLCESNIQNIFDVLIYI